MNKLKDLIEISRFYGKDDMYILAGGGNSSLKNSEKIWVKTSGASMADVDEDDFVCLSRQKLKHISTKTYSSNTKLREEEVKKDLYSAIISPVNKRPSVETSMHEIINFPYVVHTHPTKVNALMCSVRSQEYTVELFGDQVLYVEYTDPGYVLFKKVESKINDYRKRNGKEPAIIFLENHGVFVGAGTIREIQTIYQAIEKKINGKIKYELPSDKLLPVRYSIKKTIELVCNHLGINPGACMFANSDLIRLFTKNKSAFMNVNKPFTPDDIVYARSNYLYCPNNTTEIVNSVSKFKKQYDYLPRVVAIEGEGILAIEEETKSAQTVLSVFQNMMKVSFLSENFGGPRFMTHKQIIFIDDWEAEHYRRNIARLK